MTVSTPLHPEAYVLVQPSDPNDPLSPLEVYLFNPPFGAGTHKVDGRTTSIDEMDYFTLLAYSPGPDLSDDELDVRMFCWMVKSFATFHSLRVLLDNTSGLSESVQAQLIQEFGRESISG